LPLPVTFLVNNLFQAMMAKGYNQLGNHALIKIYEELAELRREREGITDPIEKNIWQTDDRISARFEIQDQSHPEIAGGAFLLATILKIPDSADCLPHEALYPECLSPVDYVFLSM